MTADSRSAERLTHLKFEETATATETGNGNLCIASMIGLLRKLAQRAAMELRAEAVAMANSPSQSQPNGSPIGTTQDTQSTS
jgi:hypothetical protein